MEVICLVAGVICVLLSVWLMLRPVIPAAVIAYAALFLLHKSVYISVSEKSFIYWGIATLIIMTIERMSPRKQVKKVDVMNAYIMIGAMAGMILGMAMNVSLIVLGVIVGAVLGLLAYVNTPKGKVQRFSLSIFIHYFCEKGLPIMIAMSILGVALESFLLK